MQPVNVWTQKARARLSRRTVLARAAGGGLVIAGSGLVACSPRPANPASTAGSAGAPAAGTPQAGGTFNAFAQYNAPLDPQKVSAGAQSSISGVMSRLFRFKAGTDPKVFADHDMENDLAISAESPDAITWTIKVRGDARFGNIPPVNGHAVEAEDVKASFVRALNPATNNPNRGSLSMIDAAQIETPAKDTVVFKLNYPFAPFAATLASPAYSWIFPREILAGGYDPSKTVIGSGPFLVDTISPDVAYTYKRNPEYFDKSIPHVDSIRLAIVPDAAQRLAQFTAGNIDYLLIDDPNGLDEAQRANPKAQVLKVSDGRAFPIYLQLGDPASVFQDIRVRRALSMAIDRDALGKVIYNGQPQYTLFVPAYMGKWSSLVSDLDQSTQQFYKYNPSEAKKLLDAAGASNLQLKFAYVSPGPFTNPAYVKQVETVSNMLNAVGLKTTLVTHDYNKDFVDAGKGSRQGYFDKDTLGFFAEAQFTDSDEYLFSYFHSKSTSNGEHLSDPTLDAMIDKERTLVDSNQRLKAVQDIQKYIADKMYVVPTVGSYQFELVQPRIQNFQYTNSLGVMTESWAKLWLKS
jgi:peptide/nickel transport system substrate-binding protein